MYIHGHYLYTCMPMDWIGLDFFKHAKVSSVEDLQDNGKD